MADQRARIEELARQNLKAVPENPCAVWDRLVAERMACDSCSRSAAVDRLVATPQGSDAWLQCQSWDAQRPKVIEQADGRRIKSGNWLNNGNGIARRIPRAP